VNEDLKYCGKCGTPNPKDSVFCENCGNRFIESPPTETVSPPPSATPSSYTPPPYVPASPSSPPPRKFKKEYVIAAVAILAVLSIVGAAAMVMSNSTSSSTSTASTSPSGYWSSPTVSAIPIPTAKPLPANAVIKRGSVGDTLSQGGLTATLLKFYGAPGYANATITLDGSLYFSPSSKPQEGFIWSDKFSDISNMTDPGSSSANTPHTSTIDISHTVWSIRTAASGNRITATAVEYRIIVPTADNSATYVFIWSLE